MSESNHTPGPWRLHDMERATVVAGKPGGEIANCLNGFGDQAANAHLIAAAPELLEALQWIADEIGDPVTPTRPSVDAIQAARAAIVKATQP